MAADVDTYESITRINIEKSIKGYVVTLFDKDGALKATLTLEKTTNFEWRLDEPIAVKKIYYGYETFTQKSTKLIIELSGPYKVRIDASEGRSHIHIGESTSQSKPAS